jgi:tetratricopeptide (TPR) repeat protein
LAVNHFAPTETVTPTRADARAETDPLAQGEADRNLLFGILALQNGLIEQADFIAAFQCWSKERSRPMAQVLVERRSLTEEDRTMVEGLVRRHVEKHFGDAEHSPAAVLAAGAPEKGREHAAGPDRAVKAAMPHPSARGNGGPPGLGPLTMAPGSPRVPEESTDSSFSLGQLTSEGGRFRLLRHHARGGIGIVCVAMDSELHREVALKQIRPEHADDPISRARFMIEAEVTGRLEHPGVVPVYGLGADDQGRPFYAMRFVRGESLKEAIDALHQVDDRPSRDPARVRRGDFAPPRHVNPRVPAALEAIVLKAMALRPADRYPSSHALAEEVERWLADEPVSARRDPVWERARRWMKRRRTVVASMAAAVLASTLGLAAVLVVQSRANAALKSANLELEWANRRAHDANRELELANEWERARFDLGLDAIKTFHAGVSEDLLLKEKQFDDLRTKLLRGATNFYQRLEHLLEGQADRRSRAALGQAYHDIGELTAKIGSPSEALAALRRDMELRLALAAEDGSNAPAWLDAGRSLIALGDLQEATGEVGGALASYQEARAILQRLADANPSLTLFQSRLAMSHAFVGQARRRGGRVAAAAVEFRRAVTIMDRLAKLQPDGYNLYNLACFRSLLSGIAADPASGLMASEANALGEQAVGALRRAIAAGLQDVAYMRRDTDLDPLRSRRDFQLLMMDLAFPEDPFAR